MQGGLFMQDSILVFCQSNHQAGLIARTLRYREFRCTPVACGTSAADAAAMNPRGLIIAGETGDSLEWLDHELLTLNVPVLALGGAAAALCAHFGGSRAPAQDNPGFVTLSLENDPLFAEISSGERMMSAPDALSLSDVLSPIASASGQVIGFRHNVLPLYAMQYPIERNDPDGAQMLSNFASICGMSEEWNDETLITRAVERIRRAAPEGRVLCAVSGGVDSAVCAKLTSMAVGDRLLCVFVDTGMFRQNEPENVINTFMDSMGLVVAHVDAHDFFLRALSGISAPRDKERIAGQLMNQMLIKQLAFDPGIKTVITGTNFNDVFFSGATPNSSVPGDVVICEPVRDLFKEEVRRLATALKLPASITERQPFPASGLALRVFGSLTEKRLQLLRAADACFTQEICAEGYDRRLWQYYATLIDSPDVPGSHAVCLRATQSSRGGAYAARMPFDLLERTAERIRQEVPGITRIVYDLTPSAHYSELE